MMRSSDRSRRDNLVRKSFRLRSEGLGHSVVSGAGFQFMGIALRTVLTIGSTAILARLLSPSDFGYIAMATVVTEFAALFGAFGFSNVLIQRKVICRLQLDTVFWATLAMGSALAFVVFALSFASRWVFSDEQVAPLLRVLCLNFLLNSLTAVPWIVLSRQLRFRTEFWIQTLTVAIRIMAAVGFAYMGMGLWSLVYGGVVGALSSVVLSFAFVPYLPRFRFHLAVLTSTWRTSGSYFGNAILYYVNTNLDLLLLGRNLGATSLGYYQNARSLTDEIRARIAMPLQHVLFPAFSAVQGDRERFRQIVMRAGRLLAAAVIPMGLGVSACAEELVLVLYGEQWRPMIPVMSMFGLSAALRASTAIASPLFNSNNQVGLGLRHNLVNTVVMILGVLIALPYGMNAVAISVAVTSLYSIVVFRAAFVLIGLRMRHVGEVLGFPFLAALLMWLAITGGRQLAPNAAAGMLLLGSVGVGVVVYVFSLHMLSKQYLTDCRQAFSVLLKKH